MHITKAARRYALALLEVAKEQDTVQEILDDINLIHNTLKGSRDLLLFLRSPIIKYDNKSEVLKEIFGERVQEPTKLFLNLLAKKGRIHILDQVSRAFIEKYNEYAGIIEVEVFAAREMSDSQKNVLHKALEEKTSKKVDMNLSLDESLRGGIAVRIDDTVIDGTVKHKLAELEEMLLSTAVE